MNRRKLLRRVAGAIGVGSTVLIGGRLDAHSRDAIEADHGEGDIGGVDGTGSDEPAPESDGTTTPESDDTTILESDGTTTPEQTVEIDDATEISAGERTITALRDEPDADEGRANPEVAEQLYAAHADRCMCPSCGGSPPGNR